MRIEAVTNYDRNWIYSLLTERWGSREIHTLGRVHYGDMLSGFVGWYDEQRMGLITYIIEQEACEIVTLDSLEPGLGIGSALVREVLVHANKEKCRRVWLITTNDNVPALRFYQKIGFELVTIYRGSVNKYRIEKPSIPQKGFYGIPIRDEIELEIRLR